MSTAQKMAKAYEAFINQVILESDKVRSASAQIQ